MIELFRNPRFNFIGKRHWAYIVSGVVLLIALISLVTQGLRYDLDFTGGALIQVRFQDPPSIGQIRDALAKVGLGESVIQEFGDPREFIVRMRLGAQTGEAKRLSMEEAAKKVKDALAGDPTLAKSEIRRVESVEAQVSDELKTQAIYAVLWSLVGILAYIAIRFDLKGGVAAVLAVFHDVTICFGALSLTHREFSLPVLAALLTIIGFSVNDTIVAYDRLRENRAKSIPKGKTFADQMNDAVNQTLSRTILTSLTVFLSAIILFFFAGKVLEDFAFVLVVGVLTGTYSTVYVAAALVVDWTYYVEGRLAARKKAVAKA